MAFSCRQFVCCALGISGSLYLLSACGSKAIDETGRLLNATVLGETGTHLGQFVYPRGMDLFSIDGHSYAAIIDKTARLQVMDLGSGEVVGAIKTPEFDRGMPTGLTVGVSLLDPAEQAIYIADTHEHRVLVYGLPLPMADQPGPVEPIFSFGSFGEEPGQFIYPTDVALSIGDDGRVDELYISEYGGNDRVSVFAVGSSEDGARVVFDRAIGVASETVDGSDDPRSLSRPQSIALRRRADGDTELVLTDSSHHRVGRFTLDGELIAWIGPATDEGEDAMRFPYGMTVLDDSTVLVTEFGGCIVRHLDPETGQTLGIFGRPGRGQGELATPWTTGVIGGRVVVLDSGNSRLQLFKASGITGEQVADRGGHP